jgi:hypothetical protein
MVRADGVVAKSGTRSDSWPGDHNKAPCKNRLTNDWTVASNTDQNRGLAIFCGIESVLMEAELGELVSYWE